MTFFHRWSAVLMAWFSLLPFASKALAAEGRTDHFLSGGKRIAVEVFPAPRADAPCVLVLHGASGLAAGNRYLAQVAGGFAARGFHTYLAHYFDRPGTAYAGDAAIRASFPAWRDTVRDAVAWVRREGPDSRVGIFGYSLGAYLAVATAAQDAGVSAVVELAGGLAEGTAPDRLPPTLVLHGDRDSRVPFTEAGRLKAALERAGRVHEMHVYPGEGHILALPSYLDVVQRGAAFFGRHLR